MRRPTLSSLPVSRLGLICTIMRLHPWIAGGLWQLRASPVHLGLIEGQTAMQIPQDAASTTQGMHPPKFTYHS
jgi:hypothetical protein